MASIKVRAKADGDVVTVKTLMSHPMQQDGQKNSKGEAIPPNYITKVTGTHKGNVVMTAHWSGAVSKNPYLSFKFKGGKSGDAINIAWTDNNGKSETIEAKIK